MKSPILILENNVSKIANLMLAKHDLFHGRPICIFCVELEAQLLMSTMSGPVILMIDDELDPGCGNGLSFLKFCIQRFSKLIEKVYITTHSKSAREEMIHCCEVYNIKWELLGT